MYGFGLINNPNMLTYVPQIQYKMASYPCDT